MFGKKKIPEFRPTTKRDYLNPSPGFTAVSTRMAVWQAPPSGLKREDLRSVGDAIYFDPNASASVGEIEHAVIRSGRIKIMGWLAVVNGGGNVMHASTLLDVRGLDPDELKRAGIKGPGPFHFTETDPLRNTSTTIDNPRMIPVQHEPVANLAPYGHRAVYEFATSGAIVVNPRLAARTLRDPITNRSYADPTSPPSNHGLEVRARYLDAQAVNYAAGYGLVAPVDNIQILSTMLPDLSNPSAINTTLITAR
jgi:hypothetical protein